MVESLRLDFACFEAPDGATPAAVEVEVQRRPHPAQHEVAPGVGL